MRSALLPTMAAIRTRLLHAAIASARTAMRSEGPAEDLSAKDAAICRRDTERCPKVRGRHRQKRPESEILAVAERTPFGRPAPLVEGSGGETV